MSEVERIKQFEMVKSDLEKQGLVGEEFTISILKANMMAFVYAGPIGLLGIIIFNLVHRSLSSSFGMISIILYIVLIIVTAFLHELLHGVGWAKSCNNGWKSIYIGVVWKALTPFCSCSEAMTFSGYAFGGILPLLILGIGGSLLSIITGSYLIMLISVTNILMAGGDITIMLMLLKHRDKKIIDHPTKCGFWAFIEKE